MGGVVDQIHVLAVILCERLLKKGPKKQVNNKKTQHIERVRMVCLGVCVCETGKGLGCSALLV